MEIDSFLKSGGKDTSNQLSLFGVDIYDPASAGLVIRSSNTGKDTAAIRFFSLRAENGASGDLVSIGDDSICFPAGPAVAAYPGQIGSVSILGYIGNSGSAYGPAIETHGLGGNTGANPAAFASPHFLKVQGSIDSGSGPGISLPSGDYLDFDMSAVSPIPGVVVGPFAGPAITMSQATANTLSRPGQTFTDSSSVPSVGTPQTLNRLPSANQNSGTFVLQGAVVGNGAATQTFRLLSDGMPPANARNCFTVSLGGTIVTMAMQVVVKDTSVNNVWYAWTLPSSVLSRYAGGTVFTSAGSMAIINTSGAGTVSIGAAADPTLNCLDVEVTLPANTSDTWKATGSIAYTFLQ